MEGTENVGVSQNWKIRFEVQNWLLGVVLRPTWYIKIFWRSPPLARLNFHIKIFVFKENHPKLIKIWNPVVVLSLENCNKYHSFGNCLVPAEPGNAGAFAWTCACASSRGAIGKECLPEGEDSARPTSSCRAYVWPARLNNHLQYWKNWTLRSGTLQSVQYILDQI